MKKFKVPHAQLAQAPEPVKPAGFGYFDDPLVSRVLELCGLREAWLLRGVCKHWRSLVERISWEAVRFPAPPATAGSLLEELQRWTARVRDGRVRLLQGAAVEVELALRPPFNKFGYDAATRARREAVRAAVGTAAGDLVRACTAAAGGLGSIACDFLENFEEPDTLALLPAAGPALTAARLRGAVSESAPAWSALGERLAACPALAALALESGRPLAAGLAGELARAAPRLRRLSVALADDAAVAALAGLPLEELALALPPAAVLGAGLRALLAAPACRALRSLRIRRIRGGDERPALTPSAALALAPRAAMLLAGSSWPPTGILVLEEGEGLAAELGAVAALAALPPAAFPALHIDVRLPPAHSGADLLRAAAARLRARPDDGRPVTLRVGGEGAAVYGPALAEAVAAAGEALEACEVRSCLPLGREEAAALAACGPRLRSLRLAHRCVGPLDPAPHALLAGLAARLGPALEAELGRTRSTWASDPGRAAVEAALAGDRPPAERARLAFTTSVYAPRAR